jgi:predicted alpha/beta superfamily hydrolase
MFKNIACEFWLILLLSLFSCVARGQPIKKQTVYPFATLINTQQRELISKLNQQTYELYISLPDGYAQSDSTYPVLYVTDANTYFGMMADMTRNLQWGGEMPETIIVGIGYPLSKLKTDEVRWGKWLAWRMRDYTPTQTAQMDKDFGIEGIKSGGANAFLQFIEQELFPFIEQNYRTKSKDRTYAGFSLGGMFGLYTLFEKPALFQRYVLGSPSIWYDDKLVLQLEKKYASLSKDLPAKVFLSAGSLEEEINSGMVRNMLELASSLKSRKYQSFSIETAILEGETHMSAPSVSFQRGLRYFFRK